MMAGQCAMPLRWLLFSVVQLPSIFKYLVKKPPRCIPGVV